MKRICDFIDEAKYTQAEKDLIDIISDALAYPGSQAKCVDIMKLALEWLENPKDCDTFIDYCNKYKK